MESEKLSRTIVSLMSDLQAKQILMGTFFQSKSVEELSQKFGIPMDICYEKVEALERLGMLIPDNPFHTPKNDSFKYYRSDLLNTHVVFKPNDIYMRFEVMPGLTKSYPRWVTVKVV